MAVAGCSTLTEGTSQEITVTTNPSGATCTLTRDGHPIATIERTPDKVSVERSRSDILITCHKNGFAEASYADKSDVAAATFSNIMTAGVGFAVDAATGADTKYNGTVKIALDRTGDGMPGFRPITPAPAIAPTPQAAAPAPAVAAAAPPPAAANAPAGHRVFGVGVATLDTQPVNAATPKHGVVVVVVQPDSPAAHAGIAEGDIIDSIGGRDIAEKGDVQRAISQLPPGTAVLVHIIRGPRQLDLAAQL
jgi:hypothetical protein